MSKRDRRDNDGRDRDRRDDRRDRDRDRDWDEEGQQRRSGEGDLQESDSLSALKAILFKVASQLKPLNLSADESIRLVEQLYGSVLEMDSAMAGEADDTRKSSTLAYVQNTTIGREGDKLVVRFPTADELRAAQSPAAQNPAAPVPPAPAIAPAAPAVDAPVPTKESPAPAAEAVTTPAFAPAETGPRAAPEARPARPPRSPRPRPAPRRQQGEEAADAPRQAEEAPEA